MLTTRRKRIKKVRRVELRLDDDVAALLACVAGIEARSISDVVNEHLKRVLPRHPMPDPCRPAISA